MTMENYSATLMEIKPQKNVTKNLVGGRKTATMIFY
uniref:Uncharacterized protein n=1 Tax=Setaria italica TaxID=4555 RepID=K3Z156_SETIT